MRGLGAAPRALRFTGLALVLLAAGCISACGSTARSLNSAKVDRAIAQSILKEHGLDATVSCPARVPQQRARVFTCTASFEVGSYPVTVTETDDAGNVRYGDEQPLVALNIAKVQHAIEISIAREKHVSARVSCPAEVLQQAGLHFRCTAVLAGATRRSEFDVQELDSAGHVRYVGI